MRVKGTGGTAFLTNVAAIAAGGFHSAVLADGTMRTWGKGQSGQLGNGGHQASTTPVQVTGLTGVAAPAGGDFFTLAVKADGTVWAWGDNLNGQLGDGTTTTRTTPVQVKGVGGVGFLTGMKALAAGRYHSFAADGNGWAWATTTTASWATGPRRTAPPRSRSAD